MSTPDEMPFASTRTDGDAYADRALDDLLSHVAILSTRTQCYTRDALAEAFRAGEHQGECRAILILAIAIRRAGSAETTQALWECMRLLGA
jgi:hypothetical protein